MQKKLIALAVAGLVSGGAFAQSNVTIYGIVDAGIEISNSGFGSKTRIQSGQSAGNRLGFKGEEALGGGTSAIFQLEAGFVLDDGRQSNNSSQLSSTANGTANGLNTGNGAGAVPANNGNTLFQRTAIIGAQGGWGKVTFGRQYAPEFLVTAAVDPFAAGLGGNNGVVLTGLPGFAQRMDNSVMYVSPNMSGFTLGGGYSTGVENNVNGVTPAGAAAATTDKAGKMYALMATYANGPAYVGLAYHNVYASGTFDNTAAAAGAGGLTDNARSKSWLGAASWNFGVVKLSGTYASGTTDQPGVGAPTGAAAGKIADSRHYTIGLQAPMGPWTFNAVYGKRDDKSAADKDFSTFSLGGEYALSKRTAMYAAWTKIDNRDRTTAAGAIVGAGIQINSALNTGLVNSNLNNDPTALQLGMRHSF